jgi:LytS/YehU family sensor histidine kinase
MINESEKNLKLALQMFEELNDDFHVATAYSYLANLYDQINKRDESLDNYIKSLKIMEALGAKLEAADNADNIASGYLKKKDFGNAIKYAQHGLVLAKEVNAQRQMVYLYNTLAKAAAAQKDFQNAYVYSTNAAALEDSVLKKEERDKLDELQTKYETEKKEKENQLLKAQNLATSVQLQNNRILLTVAVAGLVMLAIFLYLVYRNRQTKIRNIKTLQLLNKQLEEQKEEIGRINTLLELKALRAQMNPHFIFNCMSSIQECMLTGRLDEANTYLSKLSRLLRMVLIHSDDENIYLDKELEMLKLYLELESIRLKGGFNYSIDVDEDIPTEELMVPALLLQPFAENAIWHGLLNKEGERKLNITIEMKDETLCCVIKDNGIGRQQSALMNKKHKQHISKGMILIEKRLQILKQQTKEERTSLNITDLFTDSNEAGGNKRRNNFASYCAVK